MGGGGGGGFGYSDFESCQTGIFLENCEVRMIKGMKKTDELGFDC